MAEECRAAGIRSKIWKTRANRIVGGGPMTKSLCRHILGNPIYIGLIKHNDETFEGLHAPIISKADWDRAQAIRAEQAHRKAGRNKVNILTDLLFDCFGRPMSVNTFFKEGRSKRVSRIYVSRQTAWGKRQNLKRLRAHAEPIEELIVSALVQFLSDRDRVRSVLIGIGCHDKRLDQLSARCQQSGRRLKQLPRDRLRLALRALIARIELSLERVKVILRCSEIQRFVEWDGIGIFKAKLDDWARSRTHLLDLPAGSIRYSRLLLMPVEPRRDAPSRHPAPSLKRLIVEARHIQSLTDAHREKSLEELAREVNYTTDRFARVLRLNYLAPDIVTSIIDGTQPAGLTRTKLVRANLPMDWALQRRLFGYPDRPAPEGGE